MGSPAGTLGEPGDYANPAVSPDQTRIAVALSGPGASRYLDRRYRARQRDDRFTFDPANDDFPVWSPDSTDIVFSSNRSGRPTDVHQARGWLRRGTPAHRSNSARPRAGPRTAASCCSRAPRRRPARISGHYRIPRRTSGGHQAVPVLETSFDEAGAQFSPDGRWIRVHVERIVGE